MTSILHFLNLAIPKVGRFLVTEEFITLLLFSTVFHPAAAVDSSTGYSSVPLGVTPFCHHCCCPLSWSLCALCSTEQVRADGSAVLDTFDKKTRIICSIYRYTDYIDMSLVLLNQNSPPSHLLTIIVKSSIWKLCSFIFSMLYSSIIIEF